MIYALEHPTVSRASAFPGVNMSRPEPVSVETAAARLNKAPGTIYSWRTRYNLRQIGKINGALYVDYRDAATIEACIHRGDPVPATPAERDQLRATYRNAA